jgi:mRNA interferase HigB
MVIISRSIIRDFIARYPLSANQLNEWYEKASIADWKNFQELKKTFNSCDSIGNDRYVFDIGGNNIRLIAMIHFRIRTLYIRRILTNNEYTVMSKKGEIKAL